MRKTKQPAKNLVPKLKTKLVKKIFDFKDEEKDFYLNDCKIDLNTLNLVKGKLVTVILNEDEDENDLVLDFFSIKKYRRNDSTIELEVWGGDLHPYTPRGKK